MSSFAEVARVRRQQVVNLSITELMILLVFMAITYSFLAREEDRKEVPLVQQEWDELKAANERLRADVDKLKQERDVALARVAGLEQQLRQLFPDASPPVPNPRGDEFVAIPKSILTELQAQAANFKEMQARATKAEEKVQELNMAIVELQNRLNGAKVIEQQNQVLSASNAELQRRINGGKAPGLPLCTVVSGFLLVITANTDGTFTGASAWDKSPVSKVTELPNIQSLSSDQPLSETEFKKAASELSKWGTAQDQPCRFRARVKREPTMTSFDQWDKQLALVEQFFYVKREK
jgi:cell division protein FtsB